MITIILQVISGLFSAAGKLFEFMYAQQLVDAGKTAQQLQDFKDQVDAAKQAVELRETARRAAELNPSGVMSDDGFIRPDDK
jgi:hypothetical protein